MFLQHPSAPVTFSFTEQERSEYEDSIKRAKADSQAERRLAAHMIGIPSSLVALCEIDGRDTVQDWLQAWDRLLKGEKP